MADYNTKNWELPGPTDKLRADLYAAIVEAYCVVLREKNARHLALQEAKKLVQERLHELHSPRPGFIRIGRIHDEIDTCSSEFDVIQFLRARLAPPQISLETKAYLLGLGCTSRYEDTLDPEPTKEEKEVMLLEALMQVPDKRN